jgi:hypothetical protein
MTGTNDYFRDLQNVSCLPVDKVFVRDHRSEYALRNEQITCRFSVLHPWPSPTKH